MSLTVKTEYWTYKPKLIPSYVFEPLLEIMKDYCNYIPGNEKRVSCVFIRSRSGTWSGYKNMTNYDWSDAPSILHEICKIVEDFTKESYDYALVHIYPAGSASIAWHYDAEALGSSIASLSLGATRKFRFRKIGRTSGYDVQYFLNDGDLIVMHGPDKSTGRPSCQEVYQHSVPIEKKVKTPRINITFRQNY